MKPPARLIWLKQIGRDRRGATAVEYGLIMALVVLVMLAALGNTADAIIGKWNFVANKVTGV